MGETSSMHQPRTPTGERAPCQIIQLPRRPARATASELSTPGAPDARLPAFIARASVMKRRHYAVALWAPGIAILAALISLYTVGAFAIWLILVGFMIAATVVWDLVHRTQRPKRGAFPHRLVGYPVRQ